MAKLNRISEAAPAAPVAPPKAPPAKPRPKPSPSPFNPPQPSELPKPKAKRQKITENFEQGANPGTVDFWSKLRQKPHPYSKHPLLAMYGHESVQKGYEHSLGKLRQIFPQLRSANFQQITQMAPQLAYQALMQIERAERPHVAQLENLAKQIVHELWEVPVEMMVAKITSRPPQKHEEPEADNPDEWDLNDEQPEPEQPEPEQDHSGLQDEVNKRITMNALTQGAAVHNMMSIHHVIRDRLEKLDPQLINLYDQFSSGSEHMYWLMEIMQLAEMLPNMVVGTSQVEYEEGAPKIVAYGINFPVLIQELIKGTMELLSLHGTEHLGSSQLKHIYGQADRMQDEPWLIQVGPHLWRTFLKMVPKGEKLPRIMMGLAKRDPKYVHDLLSSAIETIHRGDDPKELQAKIVAQLEEDFGGEEEPAFESEFDADDDDESWRG